MGRVLTYEPGPTGEAFMQSEKYVKIICGPIGGGKSTVACQELFRRDYTQNVFDNIRRTKHLIVRNTSQQLRSTVKPLIDFWLGERMGHAIGAWRVTDGTFEVKYRLPDDTIVHSEWIMLPADTPDDVRRLLSVEVSDAWIEEMREIDQAIFEGVAGRTARFPSAGAAGGTKYKGVVGSTNPPPMGSWLQEYMADPPANAEIFMQPAAMFDDGKLNPDAENLANLDPDYYPNLIEKKTKDWLEVYLMNKFGAGGFGQPVFRNTFRRAFHVMKEELKPITGSVNPIVVGMDNGLTAAAVIGQMDLRGRVNILDEAYVPEGESMGVETFLDRILIPLLQSKYGRPGNTVFVLDPACWQRSQVNEVTIAQAVQARGYQVVRATTNVPERRIAAVELLLQRAIEGEPGLRISPTCQWLIKALDWGYRNKKQVNGVVTAIPEKNHFSHIADALQYFALNYQQQLSIAGWGNMRGKRREVQQVQYPYV